MLIQNNGWSIQYNSKRKCCAYISASYKKEYFMVYFSTDICGRWYHDNGTLMKNKPMVGDI